MSNNRVAINRGFVVGYSAIAILALLTGFISNYNSNLSINADTANNGATCVDGSTVEPVTVTDSEKEVFGSNAVAYAVTTNENAHKRHKLIVGAKEESRVGGGGIVTFTAGLQNLNDYNYTDKQGRLYLLFGDKRLDFYFDNPMLDLGKYWYTSITSSVVDYDSEFSLQLVNGRREHLVACIKDVIDLNEAFGIVTASPTATTTVTTTATTTASSVAGCTDTDGGQYKYTKGATNGQYDKCYVKTSDTTGQFVDECTGSNCYVDEGWCDAEVGFQSKYLSCSDSGSTGCNSGKCLSSSTETFTIKNGYNALSTDIGAISSVFTNQDMVVFDYNRNGDKKWRSTASGDNIPILYPGLGYYVYNSGPDTSVSATIVDPEAGYGARLGWNLLHTDTGGNLDDVAVKVLKEGQAVSCNDENCMRDTTLEELFKGSASTRKAYGKIYVVANGNSSDANTAFNVIEVTEDNLDTVTIPSDSIYWIYLFEL